MRTISTNKQQGFILTWMLGVILVLLAAMAVSSGLVGFSSERTQAVGQHLQGLTSHLSTVGFETMSAGLDKTGTAPALTPTTPVPLVALVHVLGDCTKLQHESQMFFGSSKVHPAYIRQLDEAAKTCTTLASLATQKKLTYGVVESFSKEQRVAFDKAQAEVLFPPVDVVEAAQRTSAREREASEAAVKLSAWTK